MVDARNTYRKPYYEALKSAQRSNEVTAWAVYFSNTVLEAQSRAEESIDFILKNLDYRPESGWRRCFRLQDTTAILFDL